MKKLVRISLLLLIALFMMPDDADAQRRRKKKKKKKKAKTEQKSERSSSNFQDRLWYGTGGTLNFGSSQFGNEFALGLTPMVGYKLNKFLSVGPRVEVTYNTGRYDIGNIVGYNTVDFGGGAFVRAKSPFGIYAHVEYFLLNDQCLADGTAEFGGICQVEDANSWGGPRLDPDDDTQFITKRVGRDAFYIGLGYNSQNGFSKWGYEIQLNYDVFAPDDVVQLPIDLRVGLTYNF